MPFNSKPAAAFFAFLFSGMYMPAFSVRTAPPAAEKIIQQKILAQVGLFSTSIRQFETDLDTEPLNAKRLKKSFLEMRLAYKRFEWAAEYYAPNITRLVNGPPVPEVEPDGVLIQPDGLQLIENSLFLTYKKEEHKNLQIRTKTLLDNADRYARYFKKIELYNWQIFDALKLELFRIETLGITGFDDPLSKNCMKESANSLTSLQTVLASYTKKCEDCGVMNALASATWYLKKHSGFNSFNRAAFITQYLNRATTSLTNFQEHMQLPVVKYNRLLRQESRTLFDSNAFNVTAYSLTDEGFITGNKINLGKKLFSDPLLSGTLSRSCASCHQPDRTFTDGLAKNTDVTGKLKLVRNTPTLINAALQPAQFYDLRANTLEDQVRDVIQNKMEMHGNMVLSVKQLWENTEYQRLFSQAFPKKGRSGIDTMEVMNALSSYIRSLTKLNSRFDSYMRGDKAALHANEVRGFNLFMGKARCASCHYMPLFNGAFPPKYVVMDSEVIGVPAGKNEKTVDPDPGRYTIVPVESNRNAFKIPTVRNAAKTAPYMHNGIYKTLAEVMDFYDKGGAAGLGIKLSNQTLPEEKLHLSSKEKDDLIAFVKSLDSR